VDGSVDAVNIQDLMHTWNLLERVPRSPEGYATLRVTEGMRQKIRKQLGVFEIVLGGIRIPVIVDKDLPDGTIILRSRSPFQDVQINVVTE